MTKIGPGEKNTPGFPARAAGQPAGQPGLIPARNEGKALFHKHFLQSWTKMAAASWAGGKKHPPVWAPARGKKHSPVFGPSVFPLGEKNRFIFWPFWSYPGGVGRLQNLNIPIGISRF